MELTPTLSAQEPIPRFTSGVDVVQFTVTVLDKERRAVSGLTAADFEVLVDGRPRPLAAFAAVTLPVQPPAAATTVPAVAVDVHTNQLRPEGRLVVIVMDRSTPDGWPMRTARDIADVAIDRLGPADMGAVLFTAGALRKYTRGFTTDRARLHAAVAQALLGLVGEPPEGLKLADTGRGMSQAPSLESVGGVVLIPEAPGERTNRVQLAADERSGECMCGLCVLDALTGLARTLSGATVRYKSILFIGSDIPVATLDPKAKCTPYIQPAREKLSRALDQANVIFHAVDPRGLEALTETAEAGSAVGHKDQAANLFRQSSLATLPDYTGGRVVLNTNKPEEKIGPIFDESGAYYVLAVARDRVVRGGDDRHQIKVTVKRPDSTVRTRTLYFAADAGATKTPGNATAEALAEGVPRRDFSMRMQAVTQFSPDGSCDVRVLLGVGSGVAGRLDALISAFDPYFKPMGTPVQQRLEVPAAAVAGGAGFQWTTSLRHAPPGDYEVRAAVTTADGKRSASVIGSVDVPDVARIVLALSGLTVSSAGAPTLQREFDAGAAIGLSFQVARAKNAVAVPSVRYSLRDAAGRSVAAIEVPHDRAVRGPWFETYEIGVRLPDATGRYVAEIEASDGAHSVRRSIVVTVR